MATNSRGEASISELSTVQRPMVFTQSNIWFHPIALGFLYLLHSHVLQHPYERRIPIPPKVGIARLSR